MGFVVERNASSNRRYHEAPLRKEIAMPKKNAPKVASSGKVSLKKEISRIVADSIQDLLRKHQNGLIDQLTSRLAPALASTPENSRSGRAAAPQKRRGGRPPTVLRDEHVDELKTVIHSHPELRAEQIDLLVSFPPPLVRSGLKLLRDQEWTKTKGNNRGMTYSERARTRRRG
jgi:hypothetical protein